MKISADEYEIILTEMVVNYHNGYDYVAFPDNDRPVDLRDFNFFKSSYEALEYCYEMSTDFDHYKLMLLKPVCESMNNALLHSNLLIEKNGVIDIIAIVENFKNLESERLDNTKITEIMNENNFEYLANQVKYSGFGETLEYELKEKMKSQADDFTLNHKVEYGKDKVDATLNFKKSEQGDMYFYNSFTVNLQKENEKEAMQQSFFINNKGQSITLKEAYNLMEGRAVNKELTPKEGEKYTTWIQLNMKETDKDGNFKKNYYGEKYGYDLEEVLKKHPVKELDNDGSKKELIDSLKKGNVQSATFVKDGVEVKQYIEANPQFKTIKLYDAQMQPLNRNYQSEKQAEGQTNTAKKAEKEGQATAEELPVAEKEGKGKDRKRSQSVR